MKTKQISVTKALKLKNRLTGRLSRLQEDIRMYNSFLSSDVTEKTGRPVDIRDLDKQRMEIVNAIVFLKSNIAKASLEIQEDIYKMAEMKSEITFLSTLDVKDGEYPGHYGAPSVVYTSVIKKAEINARIRSLESQIDDLQDKIDAFNITRGSFAVPEEIVGFAK